MIGVFQYNSVSAAQRSTFPLFRILGPFYDFGVHAVSVFWIISGFIFFWKYGDAIHARSVEGYKFFILRFSRLYPLHIATLLLVAALQIAYRATHATTFIYGSNNTVDFIAQVFFASNWLRQQPFSFNAPVWSVSVEILAYFAFFIILRFCKPSVFLCLGIIAVTQTLLHFQTENSVECIFYFFLGGLGQQLMHKATPNQLRAICLTSLLIFFVQARQLLLTRELSYTNNLIFCVAIVTFFVTVETALKADFSKLSFFGDMTYASYLLHFPIQLIFVLLVDMMGLSRSIFLSPVMLIGFLTVVFVAAHFVYKKFELPAQVTLRQKFLAPSARPEAV